jgi:alpha-tubulin suppressor-like RCC1 family protein
MTTSATVALRLAALGLLVTLAGCSEAGGRIAGPVEGPPLTTILSDPAPSPSSAVLAASGPHHGAPNSLAATPAVGAVSEVAYVSLPPGTAPEGAAATVRNERTGSSMTVAVVDGGFDPVAVGAQAGDALEVTVANSVGVPVHATLERVPARRSPRVVRTVPPRGKTDVPLNARIIVVFSEPIAGGMVTRETIRLLRAGQQVNGQPQLVGDGLRAEFRPDGPLASGADYTLLITNGVTDLEGEPLEQALEVTFTTGGTATQAASVTVTPASASAHSDTTIFGGRVQLTATVRDSRGAEIAGAGVVWASSNPQVARVDATGLVSGLSPGTAIITATLDGLQGAAVITVLPAIASMSLQVDGVPLFGGQYVRVDVGQTARLVATARDAFGREVTGYRVEWFSDPHLRLAPLSGMSADVTPLRPGEGQAGVCFYPASGAGWSGGCEHATIQTPDRATVASVEVRPDTLRTVPGAWVRLQAIVRDARGSEILFAPVVWSGRGSPDAQWGGRSVYLIRNVTAPMSLRVAASAGGRSDTATVLFDYVTLASASLGINGYECFLTATGAAYCSGNNYSGQLGINVPGAGSGPVGVAGGLTFATLSTGYDHSCALSMAGAAYCWGSNRDGKLGTNTDVSGCDTPSDHPEGDCSNRPVTVSGGRTFTQISAGGSHTCALTSAGAAYCWGSNGAGELGNGTTNSSLTPVAVAGGLAFAQISAGGTGFTCAVTSAGRVYCWGNNSVGQLGDGSFTNRSSPVAAAAGLTFVEVRAGGTHTCGLTTAGAAYCWGGSEAAGVLGDGTSLSPLPIAVSLPAGVTLTQIDAGDYETCGLAMDGAAYCWGWYYPNASSPTVVVAPTRVAGSLAFKSVHSGSYRSCGVTRDSVVYCWGSVVGSPSRVEGQR